MLRVIGVDMSPQECVPNVEILDRDGNVIGTAYGERNARLFDDASEMFDIIKKFVDNEGFDYDNYKYAKDVIDRVENSPELTFDGGITMQELLDDVVWGGKNHDNRKN